jgi:hypothetical protein
MKTKAVFILGFLFFSGFVCRGNDDVPVAISPGMAGGVGVVENRCPTFSWSGVAWAQKYRVAVFGVEAEREIGNEETKMSPQEDAKAEIGSEMKLTATPILSEDIAGGGLSWTPSASQGLVSGADYAWYIGAMDANGTWAWSELRRFRVEASSKLTLNEEKKNDSRQEVNNEESMRPGSALSGSKAASKDGALTAPEGPMGTEGAESTFYGTGAGANNSSDDNSNSFFGSKAGNINTSGNYNTFMGNSAGFSNTTGNNNTLMGFWTGTSNTTGYCNTFIGGNAGFTNTTGFENTFMGEEAGFSNTTGERNTFIGNNAGYLNTTGIQNAFMGFSAGEANTTGTSNTFMGYAAGVYNTAGNFNTFVGRSAGFSNTTGVENTFLGRRAGSATTTGGDNTIMGHEAGYTNTTGMNNTFLGTSAGYLNDTGNSNLFLGYKAGYNETGSDKLYIDNSDTAAPLIYGDFSTDKLGINGWLGVGTQAPAYPMEVKTTGRNAAIVANRSDGAINFVNATTTYGQFGTVNNFAVRILANAVWRLTLNTDNSLAMANGATCTSGGVWTNASSIALKENITTLTGSEAVSTLQSLNPVKYNYKADKAEEYVGFIAEEVPELVAMKDRKSLSPMDIVAVLTKVTQEQQKQLQEQQEINREQRQFIKQQRQINEKMKREIVELKKKRSK